MKRTSLGLMTARLLAMSLSARAQLTAVDNGLALEDSAGIMFANTVTGCGAGCSGSLGGPNGGGAAWVATLNAENYGGYNDWSLATGNATVAPNNTTNQLGELFGVDCAAFSSCLPFTAMISNLLPFADGGIITFGSSSVAPYVPGCTGMGCGSTYYIYSLVTNPTWASRAAEYSRSTRNLSTNRYSPCATWRRRRKSTRHLRPPVLRCYLAPGRAARKTKGCDLARSRFLVAFLIGSVLVSIENRGQRL